MQEFSIEIHSFQEVRDFVSLATVQPFRVLVGNDRRRVNGKSFMGMFSLDYSGDLKVTVTCTDEQWAQFSQETKRFLAS